tara:strand:+ start:202 stop:435 length:234 start_codon:yes stop_codon:yes gene_type:complete
LTILLNKLYYFLTEGKKMTDITKYRNVSLSHAVYNNLIKISKVKADNIGANNVSISKTIEILTNNEVKKLNGKIKEK